MRELRRILLVAALVVVAGCSSPASPPTGATTATATATAAPVPTDRPSTFLAPGVTPRGVVDPVALATAHRRTLGRTSVTVHVEESRRYENGTLRWRRTATQRVDAGGRTVRSHYVGEFEGPRRGSGLLSGFVRFPDASRVERYTVDDGAYHRYRFPSGDTWYVGAASPDPQLVDPGLVPLFWAVETRMTAREARDGAARYRLEGSEIVDQTTLERVFVDERFADVRNVSLEGTVDERGVVHRYRLTYTLVRTDGLLVRGVESVRFTDVGTTTVERPGWYAAAVNATGNWEGDDP
jgi:hypothetical protein